QARAESVLSTAPGADPACYTRHPPHYAAHRHRPPHSAGGFPLAALCLAGIHHREDQHLCADRSAAVPMMLRLRYLILKWKAMALLVAGLRDLAMEVFKGMVAEFPSDPYALASMAHLPAQGGD